MYIPYVSVNLDTISLWVIVASLESMPYNSLAINPSCYQINKFQILPPLFILSVFSREDIPHSISYHMIKALILVGGPSN